VELPVRKLTSATFVGPDLSILAVTSANMAPGDGDLAGSIFLIHTTTNGMPDASASKEFL